MTDSTDPIQVACVALAAQSGAILEFVAGDYLCGPITLKSTVSLIGAHQLLTCIHATCSGTLFSLALTDTVAETPLTIARLSLLGEGVGTIGLELTNFYLFCLYDLVVSEFTTQGIAISGCLICQFERIDIINSGTGVSGVTNLDTLEPCNLVTFRDCRFSANATYGLTWENGSLLRIVGCDVEANGTSGDEVTGSFKIDNMCPNGEGVAVVIEDCWFETNYGHSDIRIDPPAGLVAIHAVRNCHSLGGTRKYGIAILGGDPQPLYVIEGSAFQNSTIADIYAESNTSGTIRDTGVTTESLLGTTQLAPDPASQASWSLQNKVTFDNTSTAGETRGCCCGMSLVGSCNR